MAKYSFGARLRGVLLTYVDRVGSFHPNARLYLLNAIIAGAAFGVYRLLFNFFVLSMNYDETLLGSLITTIQPDGAAGGPADGLPGGPVGAQAIVVDR